MIHSTIPGHKSACDLLRVHLAAYTAAGGLYKDITERLGINSNNLGQWADGKSALPLARTPQLARLLGLGPEEFQELMAARVIELFGKKAELSEDLVAELMDFGATLSRHPIEDLWDTASAPAPEMALGFLADPAARARIQAGMHDLLQTEFAREAAEAAA